MTHADSPQSLTAETNIVDFDIHGMVGVRLLAPSRDNVRAVTVQMGPPCNKTLLDPDIVIRYVDRLPSQPLHFVDWKRTASSDRHFILFPEGDGQAKVSIPFDRIGSQCEILCERRVGWIPLLIPIINLTVLRKHGCAPVHASAFIHEGAGVLVTGWVKSGKSEALLAFSQHAAIYVGGEWVLLSPDGKKMYGLPGTFRMWDWHRRHLSNGRSLGGNRLTFPLIRCLDAAQRALPRTVARFGLLRLLRDGMPALRRQLNFRVEPRAVFGDRCGSLTARPDHIFIGIVHSDERVRTDRAEPTVVAEQLACAMEFELASLMSHYYAYKFAFPGVRNDFLESVPRLLRDTFRRALGSKAIHVLYHPYPVSFDHLYQAIESIVKQSSSVPPQTLHEELTRA